MLDGERVSDVGVCGWMETAMTAETQRKLEENSGLLHCHEMVLQVLKVLQTGSTYPYEYTFLRRDRPVLTHPLHSTHPYSEVRHVSVSGELRDDQNSAFAEEKKG
jgi:hypothetical protein